MVHLQTHQEQMVVQVEANMHLVVVLVMVHLLKVLMVVQEPIHHKNQVVVVVLKKLVIQILNAREEMVYHLL